MLDQDTARALLTIADETGARVAFVGDRHQLPAVGRGGVLDHAVAWAHPTAVVTLETVHRFTDPDYAALSLRMRTGDDPGDVFDTLHRRGQVVIHPSEVERTAALADAGASGDLVIADTRDQVADLNATIRDHHQPPATRPRVGGDHHCWRRADRARGPGRDPTQRPRPRRSRTGRPGPSPASATTAASSCTAADGTARSRPSTRPGSSSSPTPPPSTAPRATPSNPPTSLIGEHTGAAAAYVAMTRGRETNTAHLVAENLDDARKQWVEVFGRDRADLGPAHARAPGDRRHRPLRPQCTPPPGAPAATAVSSTFGAEPGARPVPLVLPDGVRYRSWTASAPLRLRPGDADLVRHPGVEPARVMRRPVLGAVAASISGCHASRTTLGEVQPRPRLDQQDPVDRALDHRRRAVQQDQLVELDPLGLDREVPGPDLLGQSACTSGGRCTSSTWTRAKHSGHRDRPQPVRHREPADLRVLEDVAERPSASPRAPHPRHPAAARPPPASGTYGATRTPRPTTAGSARSPPAGAATGPPPGGPSRSPSSASTRQ